MKTFAASQAQNNFGELLDAASREPVEIAQKGIKVAIVLSVEEFERLKAIEEELWALKAEQAEKEGFIGVKESEEFLKQIEIAEEVMKEDRNVLIKLSH